MCLLSCIDSIYMIRVKFVLLLCGWSFVLNVPLVALLTFDISNGLITVQQFCVLSPYVITKLNASFHSQH